MKLVFLTVTALLFTVISKLGHPVKPLKAHTQASLAQARPHR
jgi:hypothetical protein